MMSAVVYVAVAAQDLFIEKNVFKHNIKKSILIGASLLFADIHFIPFVLEHRPNYETIVFSLHKESVVISCFALD